ncbi:SanA/YdcF family protein [Fulvivirga sediminis]|uniref:YdcF family protein n=1 Tax=Fulvivirga sediminis TaxID=2803949 RepID=A0A937F5S7_9BACT|nr:ElyC/SanA/YdcF family protein [Fulvivirga sediminis]MBL3654628.1 YdcF family protein [Fulvivirga sediminis]
MKGLKFLLYIFILVLLVVLFLIPFYYSDISTLISDINNGKETLSSVWELTKGYFSNVDSWNILGFFFLAATILVIHSVVDHFLLYKLDKFYSGSFFLDGLLWITKRLLSLIFTALLFIFMANLFVDFYSNIRIASKTADLEKRKYTVLLLGTSKLLQDGVHENFYYTARIDAVKELYDAGYISKILISGDNSTADYNEPVDMMRSLVKRGIPKKIIKLDFAGFRTLDSIVRSKRYFGMQDVVIVSQGFHLQRALFLSWYFGVDARGYEAKGDMNWAMFLREHLAVPKMILDIAVLNTQPEYGTTGVRRQINFGQRDLVFIAFILIYLGIAIYLSYDAFDFGKKRRNV